MRRLLCCLTLLVIPFSFAGCSGGDKPVEGGQPSGANIDNNDQRAKTAGAAPSDASIPMPGGKGKGGVRK